MKALEQRLERGPDFHTRQRRADAEVNSAAELDAALRAAIDQAAAPADGRPAEPAIQLLAKLGPWVDLMQKRAGMGGDPLIQKWRRLALDAFQPGDDVIELEIKRDEANLRGALAVQPGLLRYVGKMFADFSKENLEEQK